MFGLVGLGQLRLGWLAETISLLSGSDGGRRFGRILFFCIPRLLTDVFLTICECLDVRCRFVVSQPVASQGSSLLHLKFQSGVGLPESCRVSSWGSLDLTGNCKSASVCQRLVHCHS